MSNGARALQRKPDLMQRSLPVFLLTAAVGFSSCERRAPAGLGTSASVVSSTQVGGDYTVMARSSLEGAHFLFRGREDASYWRPTQSDVNRVADLIRDALVKGQNDPAFIGYPRDDSRFEYMAPRMARILAKYPSYACQVIGLDGTAGRTIAFSFFPAEDLVENPRKRKNLDTQFVRVYDGGWYYWRIEFDLATRRFVRFDTNGDA